MQFSNTFKKIQFCSRLAVLIALVTFINISCRSLTVTKVESNNIRLDSTLTLVPDAKIESMIVPYRIIMMHEINEVLCFAKVPLYGGRPESPLTNFCADLLRIESDSICLKHWRSAVVAALFGWHPLHVESVAWIPYHKCRPLPIQPNFSGW